MRFFALMDKPESTRVVFDLIYSRFPEAPQFIMYDNACNFHKTAMKLAPQYFAHTVLVIDQMHEKGHVRCSPAFSLNNQVLPATQKINSQVAEQGNSLIDLSDFKPSGSNMSQINFMLSFRFFMFVYNLRVMRDQVLKNNLLSFLDVLDFSRSLP